MEAFSPGKPRLGYQGRGHPTYTAVVHYLYFSALVDECVVGHATSAV